MSFSAEVKEELLGHTASSRHCQLAGMAAIITSIGHVGEMEDGGKALYLLTDNAQVLRKLFTLLRKAFNIVTSILEDVPEVRVGGRVYSPILTDARQVETVLMATRLMDKDGNIRDFGEGASPLVVRNSCCKRTFLRDAFLCTGSISDPNKGYHMEFVCNYEGQAMLLKDLIESFDIEARIVQRKKYHVLYIKEGAGIVDLLNIMEAPISLMNLENLRIVKEMRNSINRKVNCEVANITKTINAASKQIEDITFIRDQMGFGGLPDNLREMAEVRLEHPDASLLELGKFLDPPVGKSGVNHRLRKLSELADRMRL
ncbi:DNA-binding protein WhiA [Butyrivibrio sp. CB08]|uniref:DNA-binding protein WhiA n=1 Tax=Butyrivibrio sp. CB08 TaxID=2364879 RepID=UPI000EA936D5|nr:DNA-binding protein WhiA [Butyrivibrio sp. CB08]RKM59968.1 DNA-binding protein WhiA [Butyrivibrio sp. CB08]